MRNELCEHQLILLILELIGLQIAHHSERAEKLFVTAAKKE